MNYSRFVFTCRLPILSMAFFFLEILCPQNAQADTDHNIMTVNIGASSSPTEETLEVTFDGTNYVASDFIFAIDPETQEASLNSYIPTGTVEELVIPAAITYQGKHYPVSDIGRQAFYNNVNGELTHVIIPNSVKRIGSYAFAYCSISSITIGNNVTHIEEGAFNRCSRLSNVTIPNSVISIGEYAFQGCRISSISIPKSVNSIGHNAFYICYLLDNITVEEGNLYYDSRNNCNAIIETGTNTLVVGGNKSVIPNSVTRIGNGAYYGRSSITNIDIPDNVISIGDEAFMFCSGLTDIMIPNSVTSIGNYAFSG